MNNLSVALVYRQLLSRKKNDDTFKQKLPQVKKPEAKLPQTLPGHLALEEKVNFGKLEIKLAITLPEPNLSLPKAEPKPKKLLVFKAGTIHASVFDMFKYYSGRKNWEAQRA